MRGHCSRLLFQPPNRPALPRHGLKPEGVPSQKPREKKRPIRPQTQSGKSVWVGGTNPFWGERRVRRWGDDNAPQGGPGAQPRHAFGSFRRETKGTPGVGRVGPLVGAGTTVPAKAPRALRHAKKKAPARPPAPSCVAPGSMVFFLIEVKKKKGRRRTR